VVTATGRWAFYRRILQQLVADPGAIATTGALFHGRSAWEAAEPWWNRPAISYLDRHLHPGDCAFEWGSGGSTLYLASHGVRVSSIEHDRTWMRRVAERCPDAEVRLVEGQPEGYIRSELDGSDGGRNYFDAYVAAIDQRADESIDIVIVDGVCRIECLRRAMPKVKRGGLLVVDDTDLSYLSCVERQLEGWRRVRFTGFKRRPPIDIRETSFFHKPL
jgi:hypothetical protein